MPRIEGIRIRNYRSLRDVTLGKLWSTQEQPLTSISAVIGKNGVGKSTLFDALGFLADCLKLGVEEACDTRGRGGFERIRSRGVEGPISFEVHYRQDADARPITYELSIDIDKSRPAVVEERLRQRRQGQSYGRPFSFLILARGEGYAWRGDAVGISAEDEPALLSAAQHASTPREEPAEREFVQLSDPRRLGIATLGTLKQHERISAFRAFIEDWYLSYFTPDAARSLPLAGPQPHLNTHGDNLGNVVQFMEREQPDRLQSILDRIATKIPGVQKISTETTSDGRLLLRFNDRGFEDPFYAQQMSDGTLKVFAYLLLLEDPQPRPFICIEEPENGLYHKLLEALASELRSHTEQGGSQIFITTHQPYFVDALAPNEVWVLEKAADGFSTIRRASDDPVIRAMVAEGLPLGGLWYSDYLDAQ
jgi:predicted ATPase